MERQYIFTNKYIGILRENVENGIIDGYREDRFPFDESQLLVLPKRNKPERLLDSMLAAETEFDRAVTLFSAYDDLTPLEASYAPFWDYLAHADLYPFVKKRWPKAFDDGTNCRQYILDHWFVETRGLMRHSLSNLWWTVAMTRGDDDDLTLTEFIFDKREDLRLALGISTLYRHKPFNRGILQFMKDNPDVFSEHSAAKERFIIQYFNRLGAIKQLAYMPESFFKDTLTELEPRIMEITSREDLF